MTQTFDSKYHKIAYTDDELKTLNKKFSLKNLLVWNSVMGIPLLLLFVLICLFPFFPHSTYGYGAETPKSFNDYFRIVGRNLLLCFGLIVFLVLFTTVIDYLRTRLDVLFKFKKVGSFQVIKIIDKDEVKILQLSGKHRLKIKSSEPYFDKIKENDIVEICLTATKRLISFKIVKE